VAVAVGTEHEFTVLLVLTFAFGAALAGAAAISTEAAPLSCGLSWLLGHWLGDQQNQQTCWMLFCIV
jgi:hypothetical protein